MLQLGLVSYPRPRTIAWIALIVVATAGLLALAVATYARRTLAPISGKIRVAELDAPVTVVRDRSGVPHLYARDEHDLFVAQGYVTAQDRLWQMLVRRQAARGQLTDWLGGQAAPADEILRRQDFVAHAESRLPAFQVETRASLEAFAAGVNACLQTCPPPIELEVLRRQGKLGQIEPWAPSDSLALALMLQWTQEQRADLGLSQSLIERLGKARVLDLWPEAAPIPLTPPADPAVRDLLRLTGLALIQEAPRATASAPGLPAAWYMAALHSEQSAIAGATWPGLPDVALDQTAMNQPARVPEQQRVLVQHLLALPPEGWLQTRTHGMLRQWYYDLSGDAQRDNASAAVYQVWIWHLARDTFQDELGAEMFNRYWATGLAAQALARLSARPEADWWDDAATPQIESRDVVMRRAYAEALDDLGRHYGDLHTIWEWDTMHTAHLQHSLGAAWPLSRLFNRAIKLGGGAPFNPGWADRSAEAYAPPLIPALSVNAGEFMLAGGQSGNPFSPHYADLLPLWQRGQSVPLQNAARPEDVKNVEGVLVLTP